MEAGTTANSSDAGVHQLVQNLTFDQLHAVRTIVSTGSFREASKILCLTQPAISQRVRHIEKLLGAPIFDRHSGVGVTLTHVGETLLEFCDRSIRSLDEFSAELAAVKSPSRETDLTVVAPSDLIQFVLVPMLPGFQERHPNISVRIKQSVDRADVFKMLSSGQADVAFDRSPTHSSLTTLARMNERLFLVARTGHELVNVPVRDRPREICRYPFVTYSQGMRTRNLIQRWAVKIGADITPLIETRTVPVMKDAVLHDGALSVLPETAVYREVRDGTISLVEIADMPLTRATAVAARPGDERSPSLRSFVDELMATYTQKLERLAAEVRWVPSSGD